MELSCHLSDVHASVCASQAVVAFPVLPIITGVCQILSCLYTCLGSCSIGQLELVITRVLLRLADGACVWEGEGDSGMRTYTPSIDWPLHLNNLAVGGRA